MNTDIPFLSRCWFHLHKFLNVQNLAYSYNNKMIGYVVHDRCVLCGTDKVRYYREYQLDT